MNDKASPDAVGPRMKVAIWISEMIERVGGEAAAARIADKSVKQICRYMAGESEPPFSVIFALSQALGVEIVALGDREASDLRAGTFTAKQPESHDLSNGYIKLDDRFDQNDDHPTSGLEVGRRLETAIQMFSTETEAADTLGVSTDQLARYAKGSASPPLAVLMRLADAKGVSLDWLATGEGAMRPGEDGPKPPPAGGIDRDLLAAIHKGVAEVYRSENARISADPLADEVARIYDDLVATYDSPDERLSALKLALHQLRRDLRAPAAGGASRKQVS